MLVSHIKPIFREMWDTAGLSLKPAAASTALRFLVPPPLFRSMPTLPFVISTEAYPHFLLRAASDGHVCGSP
jgi:hypothetical protein